MADCMGTAKYTGKMSASSYCYSVRSIQRRVCVSCSLSAVGGIGNGQILTMQVNVTTGTLRFWRDGKPHGPGYTSGVKGPLRWAVSAYAPGSTFEIVPAPRLLAFP